jgi:hypothetical protein
LALIAGAEEVEAHDREQREKESMAQPAEARKQTQRLSEKLQAQLTARVTAALEAHERELREGEAKKAADARTDQGSAATVKRKPHGTTQLSTAHALPPWSGGMANEQLAREPLFDPVFRLHEKVRGCSVFVSGWGVILWFI